VLNQVDHPNLAVFIFLSISTPLYSLATDDLMNGRRLFKLHENFKDKEPFQGTTATATTLLSSFHLPFHLKNIEVLIVPTMH